MTDHLPSKGTTKDRVDQLIDGWRSRLLAEGEINNCSLSSALAHAEWCETLSDTIEALRDLQRLRRGEFICQSCGLRKNGESDDQPEF